MSIVATALELKGVKGGNAHGSRRWKDVVTDINLKYKLLCCWDMPPRINSILVARYLEKPI